MMQSVHPNQAENGFTRKRLKFWNGLAVIENVWGDLKNLTDLEYRLMLHAIVDLIGKQYFFSEILPLACTVCAVLVENYYSSCCSN